MGSIGVVGSLLLIAWQNRQLTKQTEISNQVGSTEAAYSALERIHQISGVMIDKPETQPYFTENAPLPQDVQERARITMIAQVLGQRSPSGRCPILDA